MIFNRICVCFDVKSRFEKTFLDNLGCSDMIDVSIEFLQKSLILNEILKISLEIEFSSFKCLLKIEIKNN